MAKYLSYKTDDPNKLMFKLHSSDESKNFWNNIENNLSFINLTEDQFSKVKYNLLSNIDDNNVLTFKAPETTSISQEFVDQKLNEHIKEVDHHLQNHDNTFLSQSYLDSLRQIDSNSITWPVSVQSEESWVEALELNSFSLDSILEV